MKKILIVGVFMLFNNLLAFPYCAYEQTSPDEIITFEMFLNKETQKVTDELNKIPAKQQTLSNVLSVKIATLKKIEKVLGQILIMKKKENFMLEKQIQLNQY